MAQPAKLPRWAGDSGTPPAATVGATVEPTEDKKTAGWVAGEKPPRGIFNWLFFTIYQWLYYLKTITAELLVWTVVQTFKGVATQDANTLVITDSNNVVRAGYDAMGLPIGASYNYTETWPEYFNRATQGNANARWKILAPVLGNVIAPTAQRTGPNNAVVPYTNAYLDIGTKATDNASWWLVFGQTGGADPQILFTENADPLAYGFAMEWVFNLAVAGTNHVTVDMGLDDVANADGAPYVTNGQYLQFRLASNGNLFAVSGTGAAETATDTTIKPAVNTNHRLRIEYFGSASPVGAKKARYYVDGVLRATHTGAALPAGASLRPVFGGFQTGPKVGFTSEVVQVSPVRWGLVLPA